MLRSEMRPTPGGGDWVADPHLAGTSVSVVPEQAADDARGRSSGNSDTLVSGPAAGGGDVQRGVIDFFTLLPADRGPRHQPEGLSRIGGNGGPW